MLTSRKNILNSIRNLSLLHKGIPLKTKLTLYGDEASPPVRFVLMTAKALGLELPYHSVDLFKLENRTEFYRKINSLQKVPALKVGDEVICDSHAIALYLCRLSSHGHTLYPEDNLARAKVDEMLFFNSSTLFRIDSEIFGEVVSGKPISESKREQWHSATNYLNKKLEKSPWLTGDEMRLCDICCAATVSSMQLLLQLKGHHSNLADWLKQFEDKKFYQINTNGIRRLGQFMESLKQKEETM